MPDISDIGFPSQRPAVAVGRARDCGDAPVERSTTRAVEPAVEGRARRLAEIRDSIQRGTYPVDERLPAAVRKLIEQLRA
ncbi:MAG: hypothetical protein FJ257_04435 [Phycisphaerae bacterium]|nr:hypothetical protein [Phycisphaerae bacterium]